MTETEWDTSDDPRRMLAWLTDEHSNQQAEFWPPAGLARRLRLFACACCRQVWHLLTDPRSRRAVEVAERYADGETTHGNLNRAWAEAGGNTHADMIAQAAAVERFTADSSFMDHARLAGVPPATQAGLLRCTFGNPFIDMAQRLRHRYVNAEGLEYEYVSPRLRNWLAWNGGTVVRIAESIYQGRRFGGEGTCPRCDGDGKAHGADRPFEWTGPGTYPGPCPVCKGIGRVALPDGLPILGDCLLDAGCDCQELIDHCRSNGPHARGCWALDLLLGKA